MSAKENSIDLGMTQEGAARAVADLVELVIMCGITLNKVKDLLHEGEVTMAMPLLEVSTHNTTSIISSILAKHLPEVDVNIITAEVITNLRKGFKKAQESTATH